MQKLKLVTIVLLFTQTVFSQLSNFNFSVAVQHETCDNNGSLSINVSNTVAGSTFLYSIYKLPDVTTPISVQSTTTLSGLNEGSYKVVATQSFNGESFSKDEIVIILRHKDSFTYDISSEAEICGNDGIISVNVLTGNAISFEIFSGPITRPQQTSNVFTGLTAGVYQLKMIDSCNEAHTRNFTLLAKGNSINVSLIQPSLVDCDTVAFGFTVSPSSVNNVIKYPLNYTGTVNLSGTVSYINGTLNTGETNFTVQYNYSAGQVCNFSFTVVDGCNDSYEISGIAQNLQPVRAGYSVMEQGCSHKMIRFTNVQEVELVAAPTNFSTSLPIDYSSGIENGAVIIRDITVGDYTFEVLNTCGILETVLVNISVNEPLQPYDVKFNKTCSSSSVFIYNVKQLTLLQAPSTYTNSLPFNYNSAVNSSFYATILNLPYGTYLFSYLNMCDELKEYSLTILPDLSAPTISILEGCSVGLGTLKLSGNLSTVQLIQAPSSYSTNLPQNISNLIANNGDDLHLEDLPAGNYTFQVIDNCGNNQEITATVLGYSAETALTITEYCGTFDMFIQHNSTNSNGIVYIQKYDEVTNDWVHPVTNTIYPEGSVPNAANSMIVALNQQILNLTISGTFRIVKTYTTYSSEIPYQNNCFKVIGEFSFNTNLDIINVSSIACGASFEVRVDALGIAPLIYRIITKNNQPYLVENGISDIFSGLEPAIYTFEVEDSCANRVNRTFEVTNPSPMEITSSVLTCNGQQMVLQVPQFEILSYKWWKDDAIEVTLSTSSSLIIEDFNDALHNGIYHVQISYTGNDNSCLNQQLDYSINLEIIMPNAGQDNAVSYCVSPETIDLNTLLVGNFDANGSWINSLNNEQIVSGIWYSSNVNQGIFQFAYTVVGECSLQDEANVTIEINGLPQLNEAFVNGLLCENNNLEFYTTYLENASYSWIGPNGFISNEQNPIINNGTDLHNGIYTVTATVDGCESLPVNIDVEVHMLPELILSQACNNMDYELSFDLHPVNGITNTISNLEWVGPNGFASNNEIVAITRGELGIYGLTVALDNGCSISSNLYVNRTNCFIPNVITPNNDGFNDSLELTGFNVKRIEIYNRWGRLVYDKNDYLNQWYGQTNSGELLPDSTYYYLIFIEGEANNTGWIYLNRG